MRMSRMENRTEGLHIMLVLVRLEVVWIFQDRQHELLRVTKRLDIKLMFQK